MADDRIRRYNTRVKPAQPLANHMNQPTIPAKKTQLKKPATAPASDHTANTPSLANTLSNIVNNLRENKCYSSASVFSRLLSSLDQTPAHKQSSLLCLANSYYDNCEYQRAHYIIEHHNLIKYDVKALLLAVNCLIKLRKFQEALDLMAKTSVGDLGNRPSFRANLLYLKGLCFMNLQNLDAARSLFEKVLYQDVTLVDAFQQLVTNYLVSNDQALRLIQKLPFEHQVAPNYAETFRYIYRVILAQVFPHDLENTDPNNHFNASNFYDYNIAQIRQLTIRHSHHEAKEILQITTENDAFDMNVIQAKIELLYQSKSKHELFLLAHQLFDKFPDHQVSFLATGCYYLLAEKFQEARRYFGKCTVVAPVWAPGWIGFGHSFAGDGEYDQAISAYTNGSKYMSGSPYPFVYIARQYMHINNMDLCEQFLICAKKVLESDPLVENEFGVFYYKSGKYDLAIESFTRLFQILGEHDSKGAQWLSSWCNFGMSNLSMGFYNDSLKCFEVVMKADSSNVTALSGIAVINQIRRKYDAAIEKYHKVLSLAPDDQFATEMLTICLDEYLSLSKVPESITVSAAALKYLSPVKVRSEMKRTNNSVNKPREPPMKLPMELKDPSMSEFNWVPERLKKTVKEQKMEENDFHMARRNLVTLFLQAEPNEASGDDGSDMEMD